MRRGSVKINISLVLACAVFAANAATNKSIAVIDTVEREAQFYKPVFDIIENLGYKVTYYSLDRVLDTVLDNLELRSYQGVFFIFGPEFLGALTKSHVCVKVLQALHHAAQKPGMLIGLIFPSLRVPEGANIVQSCAPIFTQLGVEVPEGILAYPFDQQGELNEEARQTADRKAFFYVSNVFLGTPLESRPREFDTTLNGPLGGIELDVDQMQSVLTNKGTNLSLLPRLTKCSPIVKKTLPYGLHWYNQVRKNHVFITTSTVLSFAGITENYHVTPIDIGLRLEMLQQVHRMMFEVLALAQTQDAAETKQLRTHIDTLRAPSPPQSATEILFAKPELSQMDKRKIAWMDLDVFAPVEQKDGMNLENAERVREQERRDLVKNIITAGLDSLWVTANPQEHFSPIGRYASRNEQYLTMLKTFTKCLVDGYQAAQLPLPRVYIGIEITNNLGAPNLPTRYAMDLYENAYEDLPVPIDQSFWEQEVTAPFAQLAKLWQDSAFSHGVPLGGVVLDLEMYLRKKSPSFTSMMTFDGLSFQRFVRQLSLPWGTVALRDRPLLLMKHNKVATYYSFLEREAEKIGTFLKKSFERAVPACRVMCYKPNIKTSWFYTGLVKGLTGALSGNKNQPKNTMSPVQLLTFNSEFMAHKSWFDEQNLPVTHSCVFMLSKVRDENFDWLSQLLMRNGSIWFNKFSRTVGQLPLNPGDRWTDIERLSAAPEVCHSFFECVRSQ